MVLWMRVRRGGNPKTQLQRRTWGTLRVVLNCERAPDTWRRGASQSSGADLLNHNSQSCGVRQRAGSGGHSDSVGARGRARGWWRWRVATATAADRSHRQEKNKDRERESSGKALAACPSKSQQKRTQQDREQKQRQELRPENEAHPGPQRRYQAPDHGGHCNCGGSAS